MAKKGNKTRLYEMTQSLGRCLSHLGSTDILFCLKDTPKRHKDFIKEIPLPVATIDRSLKELLAFQIIKKIPITSNNREFDQYGMTPMGVELMKFIFSYEKTISMPSTQQKIIEVETSK